MKISIHKRDPDKNGLRAIRLVYYYGSKTSEDGSRAQKRSYETLNLFLYAKPKNAVEREHNKTTLQKAEAIRAKRLLEMESAKHGLDDRTKLNASFFDYFDQVTASKASGSKSNYSIWVSAGIHLHRYHRHAELTFEQVDKYFLEGFRQYLQHEAITKSDTCLSRNTACSYFNKIRAALNQAQRDRIITDNPVEQVKSIKAERTQRTYLTLDEVKALTKAECRYDVLRRAFLFSCTTGLRWSDIHKLVWSEIELFAQGHYRIIFSQIKLKNSGNGLQYLDLPDSAVRLLNLENRGKPTERVFKGLRYDSYSNVALVQWAIRAGITKHVTFHAGRHTFAVNQLARGLDIYSLSRLLGHSELRTTEIYADILETRRTEAMRTFPDIFDESSD
ncbi:site-specific integrase [Pectobacterium cacticida]|uniref:Site-specific integrase n=1 Tax=Pectobacterium cacticida TaxID=69221 RepID=A0ABZ2GBA5_9GAMM|nr:site-specific integrase [Pectobacterium cacticida]UYX06874.1 site-specific integrase [Pectobacterium cacticida]